jgi:hypothetical protein
MKMQMQAMLDTYVVKRGEDEIGGAYSEYYPCCVITSPDGAKQRITSTIPFKTIYDKDYDGTTWSIHGEHLTIEYDTDSPEDFTIANSDEQSDYQIGTVIIVMAVIVLALCVLSLKFGVRLPRPISPTPFWFDTGL